MAESNADLGTIAEEPSERANVPAIPNVAAESHPDPEIENLKAEERDFLEKALLRQKAYGRSAEAADYEEQIDLVFFNAAREHNLSLLNTLFENGADPNSYDQFGRTCLHWAVVDGAEDTVQTFLEHKADVNSPDDTGDTALHLAVEYSRKTILVSLIGREETNLQAKNK
eukprot:gene28321-35082_t